MIKTNFFEDKGDKDNPCDRCMWMTRVNDREEPCKYCDFNSSYDEPPEEFDYKKLKERFGV